MSSVQLEGCQGHGYPFGEFESAADCIMPGNQDEPDAAPALMHNEPTESPIRSPPWFAAGSGRKLASEDNLSNSLHGWASWALLSAVFAALTAIFAKIGIQNVDSDLATLVRTLIIIVVLAAFVWFTGKWSNPLYLPGKTWVFLTLSGLATGASWVCYFRALQIGDASKVAPIDKFSLVLVALFAVLFLGERPGFRDWTGIAMVAGGVILLAWKR